MTCTRFPTSGHPRGPGGRFFGPPPVVDEYRHHKQRKIRPEMRITRSIKSINNFLRIDYELS